MAKKKVEEGQEDKKKFNIDDFIKSNNIFIKLVHFKDNIIITIY